ncbi:hypothetical protein GUJ93_ZPchr0004g40148 [Zizania palustris]|uniref:Uncharacterized protein n=1 Tax=Zizania palustris TaxID=103762 RepID=A0A8J5T071_ZIZPA|nr:hypothetical protein GUJ93_ZPchr0004g40148 [Zizania palustris]
MSQLCSNCRQRYSFIRQNTARCSRSSDAVLRMNTRQQQNVISLPGKTSDAVQNHGCSTCRQSARHCTETSAGLSTSDEGKASKKPISLPFLSTKSLDKMFWMCSSQFYGQPAPQGIFIPPTTASRRYICKQPPRENLIYKTEI